MQKADVHLCHKYVTKIQIKSNMQISKKIINNWKSLKEQGDVNELAALCEKNPSTISRVLSGKQETTPDVLLKIKAFYSKRKSVVKKIEQDQD